MKVQSYEIYISPVEIADRLCALALIAAAIASAMVGLGESKTDTARDGFFTMTCEMRDHSGSCLKHWIPTITQPLRNIVMKPLGRNHARI